MAAERKVFVYIAASLDGYIAGPGDEMSWLDAVDEEGQDYGYFDFIASVDTVIVGRRTYDWVMTQVDEFPHANLESYIITRRVEPDQGKIKFHNGDPGALVQELKTRPGKNIFVDGGAEIVHQLLRDKLVDEITVSIIPILLGDGIRLFNEGRPQQKLKLLDSKSFPKGLVQVHYTTHTT